MRKLVLIKKKKIKVCEIMKRKRGSLCRAAALGIAFATLTGSMTVQAAESSQEEKQTVTYVYHSHTGEETEEGGCYGAPVYHSHAGNEAEGGSCYETPVYHSHEGNETEGGNCYQTPVYHSHAGNEKTGGSCYRTPVYHNHQGNETAGGSCYQTPVYHTHTGSEKSGGGCYGAPVYHVHSAKTATGGCYTPVYHSHTESCYVTVGSDEMDCYVVSYEDTSDGDYEGHDYKYYYMSCGVTVHGTDAYHTHRQIICNKENVIEDYTLSCGKNEKTIESYALNCSKTAKTVEKYALSCVKTSKTIEGYVLDCLKTEETIEGYVLDCPKTEETLEGYQLSCLKTEETIESYERNCGRDEQTAVGQIIITEKKTEDGSKAQLTVRVEDLNGGGLSLKENPFIWYDAQGNQIGTGSQIEVTEEGIYQVVIAVQNEDVQKEGLTAKVEVTDIKKPASSGSGEDGSSGKEDQGKTPSEDKKEETDTGSVDTGSGANRDPSNEDSSDEEGEVSTDDTDGNSTDDSGTDAVVSPSAVPSAVPTAVPIASALPAGEKETARISRNRKNEMEEAAHLLQEFLLEEEEPKEKAQASTAPVWKKQTEEVQLEEKGSSQEESITVEMVEAAETKSSFFASPAVKVITITAGTFLLLTGLLFLCYLLRWSLRVYNDDGQGNMIYLGRCLVKTEEEGYRITITDRMKEKSVTNRFCIKSELFHLFKEEEEELLVEKNGRRIAVPVAQEMIVVI